MLYVLFDHELFDVFFDIFFVDYEFYHQFYHQFLEERWNVRLDLSVRQQRMVQLDVQRLDSRYYERSDLRYGSSVRYVFLDDLFEHYIVFDHFVFYDLFQYDFGVSYLSEYHVQYDCFELYDHHMR
jgi:hypothetical protein